MKIPEYTQRITANYTPTTKVRLEEPKVFGDLSNLERNKNKVFNTAEKLSNVYFDMKKQRDEGITNEFMLKFAEAKNQWIRENKEKYRGANAQGIVDAYNQWQDEYFNSRKGFSQNLPDDELYLENEEQIKTVQDQMRRDAINSVNTLSTYAATELDQYRENQLSARVDLLMSDIANESDINNIVNDVEVLSNVIGQRYEGQSPEYLKVMMNKFVGSSLVGNVSNNMLLDPVGALDKLQNKFFIDKLTKEQYTKLEGEAIKGYIERESDNVANAIMQGYSGDDIVDVKYWNKVLPIIGKYGEDTVKREILTKARKKYSVKKSEEKASEENIVNASTISLVRNLQLLNSSDIDNETRAKAKENIATTAQKMGTSERGMAIFDFVSKAFTDAQASVTDLAGKKQAVRDLETSKQMTPIQNSAEYDFMINNLENEIELEEKRIVDESPIVGEFLQIINDNGYLDLQSITNSIGGLDKLHPVNQMEVIDEMSKALEFDMLAKEWQGKKSTTIYDKMKTMFKNISGINPEDNPYAYSLFKDQMRDSLLVSRQKGEDINVTMADYARNAYINISQGDEMEQVLFKLSASLTEERKFAKTSGMIITSEIKNNLMSKLEETPFANYSDDEKHNIVNYLINGDAVKLSSYARALDRQYREKNLNQRKAKLNEERLLSKAVAVVSNVDSDVGEYIVDKLKGDGAVWNLETGEIEYVK
jgi:hypothetical protein